MSVMVCICPLRFQRSSADLIVWTERPNASSRRHFYEKQQKCREIERRRFRRPKRTLVDELSRVPKQPHPTAVLARIARAPGVLDVAEGPLRVRHSDGHAAVEIAERRDTVRRAAGIEGITAGDAAVVIDVAKADQAVLHALPGCRVRLEFGVALAVRH